MLFSIAHIVTENEPLDTWDEEEPILTPDGDNEEEVCAKKKLSFIMSENEEKITIN
jgi:hypothetical protein